MMWFFIVVLVLMIPLVAVILDSKLGQALAARLERGHGAGTEELDRRLQALEDEVDRLNGDVDRLREESEFLHRLLEDRPAEEGLPPGE